MTQPSFRFPLTESLAIVGIGFGAWLIHNTFQPAADTPSYGLLSIGALDILLCFGLLGYLLRGRLREGEALPRTWIGGAAVLVAGFLGWIAALFLDSDRILAEQQHHHDVLAQVAKLEAGLRQFSDVTPMMQASVDKNAWQVNHDNYARLHDQLHASLRAKPAWDKELARIDEQMKQLQKAYGLILAENVIEQRLKLRGDFQQARERGVQFAESLRGQIGDSQRDLGVAYRARWHGVGAAALTGVVLLVGCLLFWLVFDRELRRSWKARARLADNEARFRALVENYAEPIAVLDAAANIVYANPAWQTSFHYELDELRGRNLLELIHPQDRPKVQAALLANDPRALVPCRLSADYGVWHDVEMQCQANAGTIAVRFRDLRETPELSIPPQAELLPDALEAWQTTDPRLAELESECAGLRERETKANEQLRQHRWLLGAHRQANSEGVLILSARGEPLSWNPAFARLWKLSEETMSAHTWQTIAAHMESQVAAGWDEFQRAASHHDSNESDTCWEMTLEGDRTLEVYAQALRAETGNENDAGAVQFHFRDVTSSKNLEAQLRHHMEQSSHFQKVAKEHDERVKHMEKQLHEHQGEREKLEVTLRDLQDRSRRINDSADNSDVSLIELRASA